MLSGCKMFYASSQFAKTLEFYQVSDTLYARFNQETGNINCFTRGVIPYPKEEPCVQSAVKLRFIGNVTVEDPSIGYDNCHKIIKEFVKDAKEVGLVYSKNAVFGPDYVSRVCFAVYLMDYTYEKSCPDEYKGYRIDTRNFIFERKSNDGTKNKIFFRSPTIAQYLYLKSVNHRALRIEDDYSYDDHINDYE